MKNKSLLFLMCLWSAWYLSQQKYDTIEVNQFKTVQIIFNDDISYVEAGTGDLQVKNKIVDNILILQSLVPETDFISTNLFIKTKSSVYNPIIKYNEKPKKATLLEKDLQSAIGDNRIAPVTNSSKTYSSPTVSTGNKGQNINTTNKDNRDVELLGVDNVDLALFNSIVTKNDIFKPSRQYTTSVWFRFYAHYIQDGKYYFKFELENESSLDYHLGEVFFSIQSVKKRKVSESKREVSIVKNLNPIKLIPAKSKMFLVFKFDSFSMNKDEEFIIEVTEKGGARNFTIGIPYFIINKPIKL